jgi:predicted esterase
MRAKALLLPLALLISVAQRPRNAPASAPAPTGQLKLTFTERSPLSLPEELSKRRQLDRRWPDAVATSFPGRPANWSTRNWDYDLASESFTAYVPPAYKPNVPHGILVWTGVTVFSPEWFPILARHKLIFIDPDKRDRTYVPAGLWVDAVHNLKKRYNIDDNRIYAAGFSNGGRNARDALVTHPDVFRGCLCMAGDNFYYEFDRKITVDQALFSWQGPSDEIKESVRIVLMRGERDTFTPEEGRRQFEGLALDGFQHLSFFVVPGIGHQHPNAAWFEKGINALDHPPTLKPPTTTPTREPDPTPAQIAQANRILNTANFWNATRWQGHPGPREVRRFLDKILDEYPTTPAAATAREMLQRLDQPTTRRAR